MKSFAFRRSGNTASRPDRGQTTGEYIVIAGVVVAILLGVALAFRGQIQTAITVLGCQVGLGAAGGSGSCGGGATTAGGSTPSGPGGQTNSYGLTGGGAPPPPPPRNEKPLVRLPPYDANAQQQEWEERIKNALGVNPRSSRGWSEFIWDGLVTVSIGNDAFNTVATRYGNWYGPGWWGGSTLDNRVGPLPPVDWLDACGQRHDFMYEIADEQGRLHGEQERFRIMALADALAARDALRLPEDPRDWVPPPADPELARRMRDRMIVGFSEFNNHVNEGKSWWHGPLTASGPMDSAALEAEADARVNAWNESYLQRHPGARG